MPSEMKKFKSDLLESVKQMRRGEAARVTKVKLPEAAEARAQVDLSQQASRAGETLRAAPHLFLIRPPCSS